MHLKDTFIENWDIFENFIRANGADEEKALKIMSSIFNYLKVYSFSNGLEKKNNQKIIFSLIKTNLLNN
ncbi:MAG: hypothetical protein ACQESP_10300 [Candidatus Muiribacteriota bacterium]